MKKNGMKNLLFGGIFIATFVLWTVLIQMVDVQPHGQNGTNIGFATLNCWFHRFTGVHMMIYSITDWMGLVPVVVWGFVDLLSLMLIFLPLYPKPVNGYIYSVNLFEYVDNNKWIITIYWIMFITLTIIGIVKILMVYFKFEKGKKVITALSIGCSVIDVLFLAMMKEPYAIIVAFLLLLIKSGLLYKQAKAG